MSSLGQGQRAMNKSALNKQKKQLQTYQRFLPALELKQQQLMAEKKKADAGLLKIQQQLRQHRNYVATHLPMLGCKDISLKGMVSLKHVEVVEEHLVGVALPIIKSIDIDVVEYGLLSKPHWVDACVIQLKDVIKLEVQLRIHKQRLTLLEAASRSATQRVNLFSKILIPESHKTIRKIQVFVSDMETAAVVRSKMTKQLSSKSENSQLGEG